MGQREVNEMFSGRLDLDKPEKLWSSVYDYITCRFDEGEKALLKMFIKELTNEFQANGFDGIPVSTACSGSENCIDSLHVLMAKNEGKLDHVFSGARSTQRRGRSS